MIAATLALLFAPVAADDAGAWMERGVAFAKAGDTVNAEAAFHRACLLNPKLPSACLFYGRSLYLLDRFADAIGVTRTALATDPQNSQLYRIEALALEGSGRQQEAEAAFVEAIKLEKNSALNEDPSIDYGVFLYRTGRAQMALAPLEAAVARHPEAARARLELGCVLLALDRPGDAAAHLEEATALDSRNARAHLLLGRAYQRLGKTELARKELDQGSRMGK